MTVRHTRHIVLTVLTTVVLSAVSCAPQDPSPQDPSPQDSPPQDPIYDTYFRINRLNESLGLNPDGRRTPLRYFLDDLFPVSVFDSETGLPSTPSSESAKRRRNLARGDAAEQFRYGLSYTNIWVGEDADDEEALKWIRLAARQSFLPAQRELGHMLRGTGPLQDSVLERNYGESILWFRRAAVEHRDWESMLSLGAMHEIGMGVPEDYALAHMWFNLASFSGNDREQVRIASEARASIAAKMGSYGVIEAQRLAREWDAAHPREP